LRASARTKEIGAVAPQIKDHKSWHAVWLGLAKRAEAEKRWTDAASYYQGAEFYLPAGGAQRLPLFRIRSAGALARHQH
jgi:hypothetical protein